MTRILWPRSWIPRCIYRSHNSRATSVFLLKIRSKTVINVIINCLKSYKVSCLQQHGTAGRLLVIRMMRQPNSQPYELQHVRISPLNIVIQKIFKQYSLGFFLIEGKVFNRRSVSVTKFEIRNKLCEYKLKPFYGLRKYIIKPNCSKKS